MQVHAYGYQEWKFRPDKIKARLAWVLSKLPEAVKDFGIEGIVVCGTSGSWLAAPLLVAQDLPVLLVRKACDQSHGSALEGFLNKESPRLMFLDDFVSTGATLNRCKEVVEARGGKIVCRMSHDFNGEIIKVLV